MPPAYKPAATKEDGSLDMAQVQKDWMAVIERHERKRAPWVQRAEKFLKVYADADSAPKQSAKRRYCVTWMNTQTRMPAVYAREPKCVVSRRYQTPDQNVRDAVVGLERVTNVQISDSKLHAAIMNARLDRLIPGRGTIWIEYEGKDDGTNITEQKTNARFVGFKDFGHGEGRVWEEVDCTWCITYYTQESLKTRFGDDVMERCGVSLDFAEKDSPEAERQASVYQIWCKSRNRVYWIAKTARECLEEGEPPLKLKGFFPHPKPLFATLTNASCIPTPDPTYYQDQEHEINTLTKRIDSLTASLKLVGFYPAGPSNDGSRPEIERALQPGFENKMIPVQSWAGFAEKGGAGSIQYLPVKDVAYIIESCVKLRQQLLNDVDRISGQSDIMQGETDPNETLGAQQLKAQYGSIRMRDIKDDFVRFAKEACEIIAEIAAENFTAETLGRIAALPPYEMQPPQVDPQTGEPLPNQPEPQPVMDPETGLPMEAGWIKLLRNQLARDVLIDVETDSTIHPDEDAEKQRRVELQDVVTKSFQPLIELQQVNPQLAAAIVPLWGQTTLFTLRGFRAGREIEEVVEEAVKKIQGLAEQNASQPPKADPEMEKLKMEQQARQAEMQAKVQADQQKMQIDGQRGQMELQFKERELALKERELEMRSMQHVEQMAMQREQYHSEMEYKREAGDADRDMKREGMQAKQAPAVGVQLGPDTEKAIVEATQTSAEAMAQAATSMKETATAIVQLTLELAKPKRTVLRKDAKTGEKYAEQVG